MAEQSTTKKFKKNKKRKSARQKDMIKWAWVLIAPTFIGLLVLNIIPVFITGVMSFQSVSTFGESLFIGFQNYIRLFQDIEFWSSLKNTLLYAFIQVPATVVIATILAVLLNSKMEGLSFYRTLYFMPMLAAPAAVAMVWRWLFNSQFGLVNQILQFFGMSGSIQWLSDPNVIIWSLIIVGIWSNIGYNMILVLAGLQEIPKTYYESATLAGANKFQQFFHISLPLLTPQLFFVVVTSLITSLQVFDLVYLMFSNTNPSLINVQTLAYMFYNESFVLGDQGYGAAIAIMLVILISILTFIQLKFQDRWVHYDI
jgi:multiple sugar transport system permease protein